MKCCGLTITGNSKSGCTWYRGEHLLWCLLWQYNLILHADKNTHKRRVWFLRDIYILWVWKKPHSIHKFKIRILRTSENLIFSSLRLWWTWPIRHFNSRDTSSLSLLCHCVIIYHLIDLYAELTVTPRGWISY